MSSNEAVSNDKTAASYIIEILRLLIENNLTTNTTTLERLRKMVDESNFGSKHLLKLGFNIAIIAINEKNAGASIDQSTIQKPLEAIIQGLECYTKKE